MKTKKKKKKKKKKEHYIKINKDKFGVEQLVPCNEKIFASYSVQSVVGKTDPQLIASAVRNGYTPQGSSRGFGTAVGTTDPLVLFRQCLFHAQLLLAHLLQLRADSSIKI